MCERDCIGLVRVKGLGFMCVRETVLGLVRVKGLGFYVCERDCSGKHGP